MTTSLFRKEAVAHATSRLNGEVMLATPLKVKLLALVLTLSVAAALAFAATASYARKETVTGWLTPEHGLVRVAAQHGGIALSLLVEEGAPVEAGAALAVLRLSTQTSQGDVGKALGEILAAQEAAASARAASVLDGLAAEEQRLRAEGAGLARERLALGEQIALAEQAVALSAAEAERGMAMLANGVLSKREADQRRQAELQARQSLTALRRSGQELDRAITAVRARIAAIPIERAAARAESASTEATLRERMMQHSAESEYVITSPIAGRIAALPAQAGQMLAPGAVVAVVTPQDGRLLAELYVPSRAAGFVRPEQAVRLMYEAFPYQRFGVGRAQVEAVSRTVLAPDEIAIPGLRLGEPVFRVRAALERDTVDAYGERIALQPGMLLRADIVIDRRSLLQWLFDPILAVRRG
jgi:membrane fusion protein